MTPNQKRVYEAYQAAGWSAHFYPRKRVISLNGFRTLPVAQAVKKMRDCLRAK